MRYIKEFANATALQAAVDNGELGRPYLCYLQDQGKIAWDSEEPGPTPHDYSKDYLTFRITGDGYFRININNPINIYYSNNGGDTWNLVRNSKNISVSSGDIILFKCTAASVDNIFYSSTCQFIVEGNIMSMLYGDDFIGQTSLKGAGNYSFKELFKACTGLTSAENLVIPVTNIGTNNGYQAFMGMFRECTSLTTAPTINNIEATFNQTFKQMFYGCSSLNYIKCLIDNNLTDGAFSQWVFNVPSGGTFVKKAGVTWPTGTSGIPNGWTVIEE